MVQEIIPTPCAPYRQRRVRENRLGRTSPEQASNNEEFRRLWQAVLEMRDRLGIIEPLQDVWWNEDGGIWSERTGERWTQRDFS